MPRFRFAEFLYDSDEARLLRGDEQIVLQPRVHDALLFFLEQRGQLLTKEQLLEKLWPGIFVNEDALTQLVRKLRVVLDEDPKKPRFLHTLVKRGYRFEVPLEPALEPGAPTPRRRAGDRASLAAASLPAAAAARASPVSPESLQPPRAAYDPAWSVPRREESAARARLQLPGMPLVIHAPERFGKTWLLRKLLAESRASGAQVVLVNLDLFDAPAWESLDSFLRELGRHLVRGFGAAAELPESRWARTGNPKANLNWLLERELLPPLEAAGRKLVLAIDRADAVWGRPFQNELFGLLRAWAENGASEEAWPALRLALVISTSPALLISDPSQSPFNLSEPVRLRDLSGDELAQIAALHGLSLEARTCEALQARVGGHPYLARMLFYAAATQGRALEEILRDESALEAILGDYLDQLRARLERQPELGAALDAVARGTHAARRAGRAPARVGGPDRARPERPVRAALLALFEAGRRRARMSGVSMRIRGSIA